MVKKLSEYTTRELVDLYSRSNMQPFTREDWDGFAGAGADARINKPSDPEYVEIEDDPDLIIIDDTNERGEYQVSFYDADDEDERVMLTIVREAL